MRNKQSLSITTHISNRERGKTIFPKTFEESLYINEDFLDKLHLDKELEGHTGCVNCLDWSSNGQFLGSGSDDTSIIIWDPFKHKILTSLSTPHQGNIFSVKFLANLTSGNGIIASGAADGKVFVHDIERKEVVSSFTTDYRVKRIAISKLFPTVIFAASEDGKVHEFDLRQPTSSQNVFLDLTQHCGKSIECKSVNLNPMNPYLMAVGCNDPYLRIYDIRKIKKLGGKLSQDCATYFNPAHIHDRQRSERISRNFSVTYSTFDNTGRELLVNLGGEQIYLYDIYNLQEPLNFSTQNYFNNNNAGLAGKSKNISANSNGSIKSIQNGSKITNQLQDNRYKNKINYYKIKGNGLFAQQEYCSAIKLYNKANSLYPTSVIYGNRAAAYIKRAWEGDFYAALRDCNSALRADPAYVKAHFRFARCLFELGWIVEAEKCLAEFKQHHPEHANSSSCNELKKEIREGLSKIKSAEKTSQDSQLSELEINLRSKSSDYKQRYCGHCNTTTDIKEANFFGPGGQYVIAGSDEGSFFIWERETSNLVRVMRADSSIVNCVQPHPSSCLLATSGIDSCVRLWCPKDNVDNSRVVMETNSVSDANQKRMRCDPLESMLISMGMGVGMPLSEDSGDLTAGTARCNTS